MIDVALVLVSAVMIDLLIGDPRRWHPVVGIGRVTGAYAKLTRGLAGERPIPLRIAGGLTALATVITCAACAAAVAFGVERFAHWSLNVTCAALIVSFMIAARSLESHALAVLHALQSENLPLARERTGWIVGRETAQLPAGELVRATVECVAESISDGVTAPLFFAAVGGYLGGPPGAAVGAVLYRSINTMDSMFGYRSARYVNFGWIPARLDDAANLIPARLSVPAIVLAAVVIGENAGRALRTWWRDALKHTSPNAGQGEAAFAGALGVRLGGANIYGGVTVIKPEIGEAFEVLNRRHILRAVRLMLVAVLWFTIGLSFAMLAL